VQSVDKAFARERRPAVEAPI